jgi:hypothetical protein
MSSIAQILIDKWEGNEQGLREDYREKLHHGSWIIEFTKTDGTPAVMEGTLDEKLMPEQKEGPAKRSEPEHLLHVYSLDREGWRSFVVANVKSFYKKPESL